MNLDGAAVLHGTPEQVWTALTDPAVLARAIPGCESLERTGPDEYRMALSVGVGAVRGTYAGVVRLTDQERPSSYVLHASGAGAPGNARAQVTIALAGSDDGTTTLTYSADAVVGGPVAGVGQRMITGVAKRMAGQFFTAIDQELTGAGAPQVAATTGEVPAETPASPQVFPARAATAGARLDLRSFLLGATTGGLLTAWGAAVGYLLGRRSSR